MSKKSTRILGVNIPEEILPQVEEFKKKTTKIQEIIITYAVQRFHTIKNVGISPNYEEIIERMESKFERAVEKLGNIEIEYDLSQVDSQIMDENTQEK